MLYLPAATVEICQAWAHFGPFIPGDVSLLDDSPMLFNLCLYHQFFPSMTGKKPPENEKKEYLLMATDYPYTFSNFNQVVLCLHILVFHGPRLKQVQHQDVFVRISIAGGGVQEKSLEFCEQSYWEKNKNVSGRGFTQLPVLQPEDLLDVVTPKKASDRSKFHFGFKDPNQDVYNPFKPLYFFKKCLMEDFVSEDKTWTEGMCLCDAMKFLLLSTYHEKKFRRSKFWKDLDRTFYLLKEAEATDDPKPGQEEPLGSQIVKLMGEKYNVSASHVVYTKMDDQEKGGNKGRGRFFHSLTEELSDKKNGRISVKRKRREFNNGFSRPKRVSSP